jgi:hypothetical protein
MAMKNAPRAHRSFSNVDNNSEQDKNVRPICGRAITRINGFAPANQHSQRK